MTDKKKEGDTELKETLLRTQANFENYRKQQEKRLMDIREASCRDVIADLLPVMDNLELALKNTDSHENFVKGVELIYSQLAELLKNKGIEQINTKNKQFDPYLHEALMKVDSDKPENEILEELQKGFVLNGQVIRHAKVKVSSGKNLEENKND